MGDPAGQAPHGFQLLDGTNLLFQRTLLGKVLDVGFHDIQRAVLIRRKVGGNPHPDLACVFASKPGFLGA